MIVQYAERLVTFKVAYFSKWPENVALRECKRLYDTSDPSAQVRAEPLEDGGRFVLQPKKLRLFTPRFQLLVATLASAKDEARELLFTGADAVVVVAREDEAVLLLRMAHESVARLPQPVPIWVQVEGGLSPEGRADLAALALVTTSGEEALHAVMDRLAAILARTAPDAATAAELAQWPSLPFAHGPRYEPPLFDDGPSSGFVAYRPPVAPAGAPPGVSPLMIWAAVIVLLALLLAGAVAAMGR